MDNNFHADVSLLTKGFILTFCHTTLSVRKGRNFADLHRLMENVKPCFGVSWRTSKVKYFFLSVQSVCFLCHSSVSLHQGKGLSHAKR